MFLLSLPFKGIWFGSLSMMLASGQDSRWGSRNIHLQAPIPSLSFSLPLLINKESSLPRTTNPAWRDAVEQFLPSIPPSSTLTSLQAGSRSLFSLSFPLEFQTMQTKASEVEGSSPFCPPPSRAHFPWTMGKESLMGGNCCEGLKALERDGRGGNWCSFLW